MLSFNWGTGAAIVIAVMIIVFVVTFFGDIDRQLNERQKCQKGEKNDRIKKR